VHRFARTTVAQTLPDALHPAHYLIGARASGWSGNAAARASTHPSTLSGPFQLFTDELEQAPDVGGVMKN
jgi:hypothetical protein